MKGKTRNFAELYGYKNLLGEFLVRDLKLKYQGSALGFLWSLFNPLLMVLVYTIAFKLVIRIKVDNFAFFLLSALLPWTFIASSLSAALSSIVDNGGLVKKIYFPREILPLSTVLFQLVQLLLSYLVLLPFLLALGSLGVSLLLLPPLLFLLTLFVLGLSLALAGLYVHFRDLKHLLEVGLQVWFWLTPIIYPFALVPDRFKPFFYFNPALFYLEGCRGILLNNRAPGVREWGVMVFWALLSFLLGWRIFADKSRRFAEEV